mmetsp:Transcript_7004/g.9729  ORF Transcript_7004/g.9729 Transcript_7004/m.9729 type:complete len:98 (+) Transcript_7004:4701-4994(+)
MTARMTDYPEKTTDFSFNVTLKAATTAAPTAVAFAPILTTDVSDTVRLEPGQPWLLTLAAEDPDDDLARVFITFSDSASDWIKFDESTLTLETTNLN